MSLSEQRTDPCGTDKDIHTEIINIISTLMKRIDIMGEVQRFTRDELITLQSDLSGDMAKITKQACVLSDQFQELDRKSDLLFEKINQTQKNSEVQCEISSISHAKNRQNRRINHRRNRSTP